MKKKILKFLLPLILFLLLYSNVNATITPNVIQDVIRNVILDIINEGDDFLSFYAPLVADLELDEGIGVATRDRESTATVKDYNDNLVICAFDEMRFEGARRVHEERWSAYSAENAIEFDGTDDDILVPDNAAIQNVFDGGGSIACWIKPKSDGGGNNGRAISKNQYNWYVNSESSGFMKITWLYTFSGDNGRWVLSSTDIPINQWAHVLVTYDNSDVSNNPIIYINGVAKTIGSGLTESQTPTETRATDMGDDFFIGDRPSKTRTFDGAIDSLKIWTTELTQAEVTTEYNTTRKTSNNTQTASLAGWWKLDDTDSSITDYSGNGNTGTFRDNTTPASPTNVDGMYDDGVVLTGLQGVLIEVQGENEIDWSEALDNATGGWAVINSTNTLNQALSPDGINLTATKCIPDAGTGARGFNKNVSGLSDNIIYTHSIFVKQNDYQWVSLTTTQKDGTQIRSWFDIQNVEVGTMNHTSSRIEAFADSWYRLSVGVDILSGGTTPAFKYRLADADNNNNATGDGSKYNLFLGADVEQGSKATSYIATAGATATRLKDILYYDAIGNVNEAEGSMICDFNILGIDSAGTPALLTISDNSASDFLKLYAYVTNITAKFGITSASSAQTNITGGNNTIVYNTNQSIGGTYKLNDIEGFIDGESFGTDTSANMPIGLSRIYIGSDQVGANQINGTVKEVMIYKQQLLDEDIELETQWNPWDTWGD